MSATQSSSKLILSLYKQLLRESQKFSSYNIRFIFVFFIIRIISNVRILPILEIMHLEKQETRSKTTKQLQINPQFKY